MLDSLLPGLAVVLAAGLFQGSFMAPSKWIKGWAWENYWLIFAQTAYLICPWLIAVFAIPRLPEVYFGAPPGVLLVVALLGIGWGAGAITFGLGVEAIGISLGFAIILGVAATCGTLIPLLISPPKDFSMAQGLGTAASIAVMLAGVAFCSLSGRWKESQDPNHPGRSYWRGVAICLGSGVLSSFGNLGFAFGAEITQRAQNLGVPSAVAPNALWTLLTLPLFFANAVFALFRLIKNRTFSKFVGPGSLRNGLLAFLMGAMWMTGISLYGTGARLLGDLGPSLGWTILMSTMVVVANLVGLLTGEWKGAPEGSKSQLLLGVLLLIVAIVLTKFTIRA